MTNSAFYTVTIKWSSLNDSLSQDLAIRQFLLRNLIRRPGSRVLQFRIPIDTLASSLDGMGDFPFEDPTEAVYHGPTLFVRGTKSHYISASAYPQIKRFFPNFASHDIDCGHWVISERPVEFRDSKQYLDGVLGKLHVG